LRAALDTNILAYAAGVNDTVRQAAALALIEALPDDSAVIPVQALGELFHVLVRKAGWPAEQARETMLGWCDGFDTIATTPEIMAAAAQLSVTHQLSIWDAVMFAAANAADCRLLLSEDLQGGFTWEGVTVVNPFAPVRHKLLDALLNGA
jgi:predicted nucleic acid-binding protein